MTAMQWRIWGLAAAGIVFKSVAIGRFQVLSAVVYLLQGMGIDTGIDLDKLVDAGKFISDFLGRKPNSRVATAIINKRAG